MEQVKMLGVTLKVGSVITVDAPYDIMPMTITALTAKRRIGVTTEQGSKHYTINGLLILLDVYRCNGYTITVTDAA